MVRFVATLALIVFGALPGAYGNDAPTSLSLDEFRNLVAELAPKVNLFKAVWKEDPNAQFYGGTSRDFIYWIKRELSQARNRAELDKKVEALRGLGHIDVRDFIIGDSDVDVLTARGQLSVSAQSFALKKIDFINPSRLDPNTPAGLDEIRQGYIPVEKIQLGKNGVTPSGVFGDGLKEIHDGNLSIQFSKPEEFAQTHFARLKLNHPVLLALRYLRLQAMDYFNRHGKGFPDAKKLMPKDPAIVQQLKTVIAQASNDPSFVDYLKNEKFEEWLNGTIQKAFRSYTNPTAAMALMKEFGVDRLVKKFSLQPINQYLFAKNWDLEKAEKNFSKYGVTEASILSKPSDVLPDLEVFHGTKKEEDFRSILMQGILSSEDGTAKKGLYAVSNRDIPFAENWAGDRNRVVRFQLDPKARVIDLTRGPGKALFALFQEKNPGSSYDEFAEAFGIDVIRYEYPRSSHAVVVKNSAVLGKPQGAYRQLLTLRTLLEKSSEVKSVEDLRQFGSLLDLNRVSSDETIEAVKNIHQPPEFRARIELLFSQAKKDKLDPAITQAASRFILDHTVLTHLHDSGASEKEIDRQLSILANDLDLFTEVKSLRQKDLESVAKVLTAEVPGNDPGLVKVFGQWKNTHPEVSFSRAQESVRAVKDIGLGIWRSREWGLGYAAANGALLYCLYDHGRVLFEDQEFDRLVEKKIREEKHRYPYLYSSGKKVSPQEWEKTLEMIKFGVKSDAWPAIISCAGFGAITNTYVLGRLFKSRYRMLATEKQEAERSFLNQKDIVFRLNDEVARFLRSPDSNCSRQIQKNLRALTQ